MPVHIKRKATPDLDLAVSLKDQSRPSGAGRPARPTLGAVVRALRLQRDLTLKEMSVRTGIPFSTLSKVENDRLTLTYEKLVQLAERLNIRLSDLFAEAQPAQASPSVTARRSVGSAEAAYVLEGQVIVHTEFYDPVTLDVGQVIYLDSGMGHAYVVGEGHEEALMIGSWSSHKEDNIDEITKDPH